MTLNKLIQQANKEGWNITPDVANLLRKVEKVYGPDVISQCCFCDHVVLHPKVKPEEDSDAKHLLTGFSPESFGYVLSKFYEELRLCCFDCQTEGAREVYKNLYGEPETYGDEQQMDWTVQAYLSLWDNMSWTELLSLQELNASPKDYQIWWKVTDTEGRLYLKRGKPQWDQLGRRLSERETHVLLLALNVCCI